MYAPQSGCDVAAKQAFYTKADSFIRSFPSAHPVFIAGDFNARLHGRLPEERDILGNFVYGRGLSYLQHTATPTAENRSLFIDFCIQNGLCVTNTLFDKTPQHQLTFREAGVPHAPPWTPDKFAQIDFLLLKNRWTNSVLDVTSHTDWFIDSDHYLVVAKLRVKFKHTQSRVSHSMRFRPPYPNQALGYNRQIMYSMSQQADPLMTDFLKAMADASKANLTPVSMTQRKRYLSDHTWSLIEERQQAHAFHDGEKVKDLTVQIKKNAKKDKQRFLLNNLMESNDPRKQWTAIKNLKKPRSPNFTKLKDKDGNRVGPSRRAEAIAEYLHEVQWKEPALPPRKAFRPNIVQDQLDFNTGPIDSRELDTAIRNAKANKTPGPDNISAELFKILDYSNRTFLLSLFNRWWVEEQIPEEHLLAQVVTIFKKGDTQKIWNYRPISLLNIAYKLYASIV